MENQSRKMTFYQKVGDENYNTDRQKSCQSVAAKAVGRGPQGNSCQRSVIQTISSLISCAHDETKKVENIKGKKEEKTFC